MRGWLTPDNLPTEGDICRPLLIPNEQLILAAVNGALVELAKAYNWQAFGSVTPSQMAERMQAMIDEYFEGACPVGGLMIGTIFPYATANPPAGSVACDGTEYADTDYPAFWAVIDPAWKTDATHWAIDARDLFLVGAGNAYGPADSGGADSVTLTESQMPAHGGHSIWPYQANASLGANAVYPTTLIGGSTVGGGGAHENRPPYLGVPYAVQVE